MIRTAAVPRSLRVGAAAASVAGLVLLAGCAADTDTDTIAPEDVTADESTDTGTTDGGTSTGAYTDGTYTAEGSYQTPESVETISVTLTIADDTVTAVEVTGDPQARESEQYQGEFIGGIADLVVGKSLDEIEVDRVAGSSLTSGGFNQAVEEIRADAAA
ncbi:FMN-binding protein [Microbacterium dauci]|uniref:FMN-binding protein n=1 Tax=Microbacterium dauci TaxID=3048008 RepID=A0ABT6ZB13_9MICO|nr:FMN-binding protein [Microbacterium sp. LX3-4]MDJ1113349.1 FMN-binding protein [Microbacterium sp. LX3-4]